MKILIIGLGSIARKHITALRQILPQCVIYALRSTKNPDQVDGVNDLFSFDDALLIKPDFIIISNPTHFHEETIRKCLSMRCPLFIEKPILESTIHAQAIIDEINTHQIYTYVACNLRFHPAINFLKNYISNNSPRINEVNIYCGSYLPDWRVGKDFRKFYSTMANMGGGAHLDLIHEIDYCTWLFGMPDKTNSLLRKSSSLHIDAVDFASYHLFYNSFTANIILNYYRKDSKREIEILTEDDTIKADLLNCNVISLNEKKILFSQDYLISETYMSQMKYFIDHITNKLQPMNDVCEAIDVLKIALS